MRRLYILFLLLSHSFLGLSQFVPKHIIHLTIESGYTYVPGEVSVEREGIGYDGFFPKGATGIGARIEVQGKLAPFFSLGLGYDYRDIEDKNPLYLRSKYGRTSMLRRGVSALGYFHSIQKESGFLNRHHFALGIGGTYQQIEFEFTDFLYNIAINEFLSEKVNAPGIILRGQYKYALNSYMGLTLSGQYEQVYPDAKLILNQGFTFLQGNIGLVFYFLPEKRYYE